MNRETKTMTNPQGQARLAERMRRLYLPPSDLPVFCTLCEVNAATGLCPVCLRSLEEIADWPRLDEAHRRTVWGRVQTRLMDMREAERAARRLSVQRRVLPQLPTPESLLQAESERTTDDAPLVSASPDLSLLEQAGVAGLSADAPEAPASAAQIATESSPAEAEAEADGSTAAEVTAEAEAAQAAEARQAETTDAGQAADEAAAEPADKTADAAAQTVTAPAKDKVSDPALAAEPKPATPAADAQAAHPPQRKVPVDVAAERERQVRQAMVEVVQAALQAEASRTRAKPADSLKEITLKPLI
jgi:predicted Fe-S protein YdhL (DUF1289 family)